MFVPILQSEQVPRVVPKSSSDHKGTKLTKPDVRLRDINQ